MARKTYVRCRCCGLHRNDGASLSNRGYCSVCGPAIREKANDDMHYHRGDYFQHWRRAHAAAVGAVLVDDLLAAE